MDRRGLGEESEKRPSETGLGGAVAAGHATTLKWITQRWRMATWKSAREKLASAARLRAETTLTIKRIAELPELLFVNCFSLNKD